MKDYGKYLFLMVLVCLFFLVSGTESLASAAPDTLTFSADTGARGKQKVTVTRGKKYRYEDYGYGTFLTYAYQVEFGGVKAAAYCVQPSSLSPDSGKYSISKMGDNKALAKVCYYGTKVSEDDGFFTEENGYDNISAGARVVLVHLAASYANKSKDAFSGANGKAQKLAKKLYDYCVAQPEIPDVEMSFSDAQVKAYADGERQRTKEVTFRADTLQTIVMKLPVGVRLHNCTTGKTSKAGEQVEIGGGTRFYLSAPLTQAEDVAGVWASTMRGGITKDFSAYKISTGSGSQDLALVFGEGVDDEKYIDFQVSWLKKSTVEVKKADSVSGQPVQGAVYGIYQDPGCEKLITEMQKTDQKGRALAELIKTQDQVYVKEVQAPEGYMLDETVHTVKLFEEQVTLLKTNDQEQMGKIVIHKEGEKLVGVNWQDNGTEFQYEMAGLQGAVYNLYAGEDIYTGTGHLLYQKEDLVRGDVKTDESGEAVIEDLHLGTYLIREVQAPEGYVNDRKERSVTLSYGGQLVPVVTEQMDFVNDRQQADIQILKTEKGSDRTLAGAVFGLYVRSDILTEDGECAVPAETLIEKQETNRSGEITFLTDLPIGYNYYVKELEPPEGYKKSGEIQELPFYHAAQDEKVIPYFCHFENEPVVHPVVRKVTPKTADTRVFLFWMGLSILSAAILFISIVHRCDGQRTHRLPKRGKGNE